MHYNLWNLVLALECAKNVRSVGEQQSIANFLINGKEMPSPGLGNDER
jgi:hypothetical protein